MCGISGAYASDGDPGVLARAVKRMVVAMRHRGPDAHGDLELKDLNCSLGHDRLSIIDLSDAARQPMSSPDGRYSIVFNGEVYNFRDLRETLRPGRPFASSSDTEVVLAAFERWGTDAFLRLNGMFAVAIVDRSRRRLVLARDRLGIKPLYYAKNGTRFVFASEIKGIVASGLIDTGPDLSRMHEFLYFGNTLGAPTMYRGIERLSSAHWLELDMGSGELCAPRPYWTVPVAPAAKVVHHDAAVEQTRELLDAAVARQLISDVPVGVFLSGGVDSTAIVALASRHYQGRLRTYSVGFDYIGDGQELPKARSVAARFGTDHHELHVSGRDIEHTIRATAAAHDQPFADPANLPLYQLCQATAGETKVILQGDGGDELFGGYRRYEYLRAASLARPLARAAAWILDRARGAYGRRTFGAHRFFRALAQSDVADRMALLLSVEGPLNPPTRILHPDLRATVERQDPFLRYRQVAKEVAGLDELQQMLLTDLRILLPDIFLEKVDRSTMAMSIEVRVPFLDFDLVDFVAALPASYKVGVGQRKRLLRAALRDIVPPEILAGRKMGFGVPIAAWLRGPLRGFAEDLICSMAGDWFDKEAVRATFNEHVAGRRDHAQLLWKALQCALWRERLANATAG